MPDSGLDFGTSLQAVQALSKSFKSHTQNLGAASAVAGRTDQTFISAFETNGDVNGVQATTVRSLDQVGPAINAPISTYFSIGGPGFIPVSNATIGGTTAWSRNGTFAPDANSNFVNEAGDFLQVYLINRNGSFPDVTDTDGLQTLNISGLAIAPVATSTLTFSGVNLPASDTTSSTPRTQTVTVLDSLGNEQNLTFTWTRVDTTSAAYPSIVISATQGWALSIAGPSGSTIGSLASSTTGTAYTSNIFRIMFNSSGTPIGFDNNNSTNVKWTIPPQLTINWGTGSATAPSTITLANIIGTPTNPGITSTGSTFSAGTISHDGNTAGTYKSIAFNANGLGTVTYTNDAQKSYCGIPIATFNNPNGLREIRAGVFEQTPSSGGYTLLLEQKAGESFLVPGTYEGSAVDVTQTYVQMIEDQQKFMANLKAIETINGILNDLEQI
jgi:flagellar hook protein FlgE